jgi:hypothetical protein
LIEQANLPTHPDRPPFATALSVALAIGVFAGILFAVVQAFHVWKPIAVLGLAGAVLGAAGASALPRTFDGLSVVSCRTTNPADVRNLIGLATAPQRLTVLIQRFHLYTGDSRPELRLRQSLNINPVLKPHGNPATRTANGSYDINIRFRYSDQSAAQLVTEAIAARLTEADNQQRVGIASEMVAPVFVHAGPPAPSASIGLIAGLVFGICERRSNRLQALAGIALFVNLLAPPPRPNLTIATGTPITRTLAHILWMDAQYHLTVGGKGAKNYEILYNRSIKDRTQWRGLLVRV